MASPLDLKLRTLGVQADDSNVFLEAAKRRLHVAAHESIIREADTAEQVRILLAGTACAYKTNEDGARSILSFHHAGDFCDLHRYVLSDLELGIQALTDCTVAIIDYQNLDELLSRPAIASAFWRASMLEMARYRERLSSTGRSTALERVAHLLCEQLARREAVGIHSPRLPFSQIDIADAAGLSVVHVNRTVQTLRMLNVLSRANRYIEVMDRKHLAKIGKFDGRYLNMSNTASNWAVQVETRG